MLPHQPDSSRTLAQTLTRKLSTSLTANSEMHSDLQLAPREATRTVAATGSVRCSPIELAGASHKESQSSSSSPSSKLLSSRVKRPTCFDLFGSQAETGENSTRQVRTLLAAPRPLNASLRMAIQLAELHHKQLQLRTQQLFKAPLPLSCVTLRNVTLR